MTKVWDDLIRRVQSWPQEAQQELVQVASEIEDSLKAGTYRATPSELLGIDRGLRKAAEGKFVSSAEVEATFAKYSRS